MAFVTETMAPDVKLRRPVAMSRTYGCRDAALAYVEELRKVGADEPYIQAVERVERKVPDIA